MEIDGRLFFSGGDEMIVYKVFCKDHELKKDDLIGVLTEKKE